MKVEQQGHTIIIRDTQGNAANFLEKVTREYHSFENHNLILDISHDTKVTIPILKLFGPLSKQHRKSKKSFVLVAPELDYNALPSSIVVVPSLLEAHDIIQMDEIERDLGF
ncbi:MAG: ribonuclease Z [Flavobacterium sp.]|nr:ribonuclease Z [Flavobacterium sp.]